MIESIIEKSVKNRALLLLTLLIAAFLSFWAIRQTPLDALPDLTPPQVIVNVKYLGQSPKIIQDQLVYELTNALLSVAKTKTVRAFTSYENAIVYIILKMEPTFTGREIGSMRSSKTSLKMPLKMRPSS